MLRRVESCVEEHPREKGPEEALHRALREAAVDECPRGRDIRRRVSPAERRDRFMPEADHPPGVGGGEDAAHERAHAGDRSAPGIRHAAEPSLASHQCSRCEWPEIKCAQVERALRLGIRVEQHLEAAIEQEPVDLVGRDAAADCGGCLEQQGGDARRDERARGGQSRQPASDDHDLRLSAHIRETYRTRGAGSSWWVPRAYARFEACPFRSS